MTAGRQQQIAMADANARMLGLRPSWAIAKTGPEVEADHEGDQGQRGDHGRKIRGQQAHRKARSAASLMPCARTGPAMIFSSLHLAP